MKKCTVNSLAVGNIKHRKKQYILMTVGIVLAMVFSSGILFFASALLSSIKELTDVSCGSQDVILFYADKELAQGLDHAGITGKTGFGEKLGFAFTQTAGESKGTAVVKLDENALALSRKTALEGRLPEKAGEIAIEKDALIRLGLADTATGDTVTLTLKVSDGNDYLPETVEKTYTLTGILRDQRLSVERLQLGVNDSYPSALVSAEEQPEPGGRSGLLLYFNYADGLTKTDRYTRLHTYLENAGYFEGSHMDEWIFLRAYVEDYRTGLSGMNVLGSNTFLSVTLSLVLTAMSCVGIVNAFNTNLRARRKQIGMLRAVGATKRQIISVFGREALILSLVSAPASVIISYFAVKFIIGKMGGDFVFKPSWWVLLASAAAGVLCVLLASFIPLVRISKTSPMLAIRSTDYNRKVSRKHIKTEKSFDTARLLAKRETVFGRGRMAAVSILLLISVLLGTLGFSWVQIEYRPYEFAADYTVSQNFDSRISQYMANVPENSGISDSILNSILSLPHVKSVETWERRSVNWLLKEPTAMQKMYLLEKADLRSFPVNTDVVSMLDPADPVSDLLSERFRRETEIGYKPTEEQLAEKFGYGENVLNCTLEVVPDRITEQIGTGILEGKIDREKLDSGEEIILVLPEKLAAALEISTAFDETDLWAYTLDGSLPMRTGSSNGIEEVPIACVDRDIHAGDEAELSILYSTAAVGGEDYDINDIFADAAEHKKTVRIAAIVKGNYPEYDFGSPDCTFITTKAGYESFGLRSRPERAEFCLTEAPDEQMDEIICAELEKLCSGTNLGYTSAHSSLKQQREEARVMYTALISVLLLFFTISTAMINNALTARIRESRRQIGTLRAVGASLSELTRSYILQLVRMFVFGTAGGFAIYNIVYLGVFIYEKKQQSPMPIDYYVLPSVLLCAVVFAVCAVNMVMKIKQQTKNSIVDNIRDL